MARALSPAPGTDKPIQRGRVSLPFGQTDVTISTVNMAKTHLNFLGPGMSSSFTEAPGWGGYLLNATTIRFISVVGGGASVDVSYEVMEKY